MEGLFTGIFGVFAVLVISCNAATTHLLRGDLKNHTNSLQIGFGLNFDFDSLNQQIHHNSPNYPFADGTSPFPTTCTGLNGLQCKDCTSFMVCADAIDPIFENSCPSANPYCYQGACQATPNPDSTCTSVTPTFPCTSEGFFPDPVDCKKFHYCAPQTGGTWKVSTTICPSGFTFNSLTNNCIKTTSVAACKPFVCKEKQIVTYAFNSAYYAVCKTTTVDDSLAVLRCVDTKNMFFNLTSFACEFRCRAEGYFADSQDSAKFYFCHKVGNVFVSRHESCPEGYLFKDLQCQLKTDQEKAVEIVLGLGATGGMSTVSTINEIVGGNPGQLPAVIDLESTG